MGTMPLTAAHRVTGGIFGHDNFGVKYKLQFMESEGLNVNPSPTVDYDLDHSPSPRSPFPPLHITHSLAP